MSVRLSDDLAIDMPFIGKDKSNANAAGYLRDNNYYFNELYKKHPEYFSATNVYNLQNGYAIVNDATFRNYFPEYDVRGLRGNPLIHHHVGGGKQAVAVPQNIHIGSGGIHNNEKALGIWNNNIE